MLVEEGGKSRAADAHNPARRSVARLVSRDNAEVLARLKAVPMSAQIFLADFLARDKHDF
jgi:hypothetical protein